MKKIPSMVQPNPSYGNGSVPDFAPNAFQQTAEEMAEERREEVLEELERDALEAVIAYRVAQIATDRHVYADTPRNVETAYTEADLLNLYVASRIAIDKVIEARAAASPKEE